MTRYHHHWFVWCICHHENISKHIDVNHFEAIIGLMCLEKSHKIILQLEKSRDVEIYLISEIIYSKCNGGYGESRRNKSVLCT